MNLYWLSFVDPARTVGHRFLGACLVEAASMEGAVFVSHMLGVNPGGEIAIWEYPEGVTAGNYPVGVLLSKAEIDRLDRDTGR